MTKTFWALLSISLLAALPVVTSRYTATQMVPPTAAEAQAEVQKLISSKAAAGPAVLGPLWSALPPIRVEQAIGTYHGGLFNGPEAKKSPINWYGKQIINETTVNPLLCNAPNDGNIVFPYPRENIAQARNIEHDGVLSATIVYNKIPLMDYFRVIKQGNGELWLLGKSDILGKAADPPYFYLKRVEGVKIDMTYKNP
jgi:hypothetical protein